MARLLVAAFALQLFFAPAAAYSTGGGDGGAGQSCDALNVCEYGDKMGEGATCLMCTAGNFGGNPALNGNCASANCTERRCPGGMALVGKPTRTDVYTVRTGDGAYASADPKSYVPGQLLRLYVDVAKPMIQKVMNTGRRQCACKSTGSVDQNGDKIPPPRGHFDCKAYDLHNQCSWERIQLKYHGKVGNGKKGQPNERAKRYDMKYVFKDVTKPPAASDPADPGFGRLRWPMQNVAKSREAYEQRCADAMCAYCPPKMPCAAVCPAAWIKNNKTDNVGGHVQCAELMPYVEEAQYIGLLAYAVDASGEKVGAWEIPRLDPPIFWTPPDYSCSCGGSCPGASVMHYTADPKPYSVELPWRAPNVSGTGKVTFRVLLKQGETNGGAFYWPTAPAMAAKQDLQLAEAADDRSKKLKWVTAGVRQNCDEACKAATLGGCDADALKSAASSPSAMLSVVGPFRACSTPVLTAAASTAASAPRVSSRGDGWCFVAATGGGQPTCAARPPINGTDGHDVREARLCPCLPKPGSRRLQEQLPPGHPSVDDQVDTSGCPGQRHQREKTDDSALELSSHVSARGLALFGFATLLLPHSVVAHNWMTFPRSRQRGNAGTKRPKRFDFTTPHVQTNAGKDFVVGFKTGHGGMNHFVLVKAEDEPKLESMDLGAYLAEAPADQQSPYDMSRRSVNPIHGLTSANRRCVPM